MSYLITYVGSSPAPHVMTDFDSDEVTVKEFANDLAGSNLIKQVVVYTLDSNGFLTKLAVFGGDESISEVYADPAPAASAETYNGYCVKCRVKRDFTAQIVTVNNRRLAKGKCPECGVGINRFLPNKDKVNA